MTKVTGKPFKPGQIILVHYPFTDHTAVKLRPAVVVSSAKFNNKEDFVALPISSQVSKADPLGYLISAESGYFTATKLRKSSLVKWTKPMTISKKIVKRKLGTLPADVLKDLQARLKSIFD